MPPRKRPFGVTVIVFMELLALLVFAGGLFIESQLNPAQGVFLRSLNDYEVITALMQPVRLIVALGLWYLRRWAWVVFMITLGVNLSLDLAVYVRGEPNYISMVFNLILVFYLNQRDVQQIFQRRHSYIPETTV